MKTRKRKTIAACLAALALLLLFCALLVRFGVSTSLAGEAARSKTKMDSIEELMSMVHTGQKERSYDWLKENNERIVSFMADALRVFVEGDEYTGPRMIGEGVVVELDGDRVVYPQDMEEGYIRLSAAQVDRMRLITPDNAFLGFVTETGDGTEEDLDWEHLELVKSEERNILAALFGAKITDRFYYVERTVGDELYEYVNTYVGYNESIQGAERAYGGAILDVGRDDLKPHNESLYFPGAENVADLGFTREVIEARTPIMEIGGDRYLCTYGGDNDGDILIYLHPIDSLRRQDIGEVTILGAIMFLFLAQSVCYLASVVSFVHGAPKSQVQTLREYAPDKIRRKMVAGGLFGVSLVFLIAVLIQSLGTLYTETIASRTAVDALIRQIRVNEEKKQQAVIEEEADWYVYYGSQLARLIEERPELGNREMLQTFSDTMGIDYTMLFDADGNETACSKDYYGFSIGAAEGSYLHEFRRLLMGVPSIWTDAAKDKVTGLTRQMVGVTLPSRDGAPGALLMALEPERLNGADDALHTDSRLPLLTTEGTLCLTADQDGTILGASNPVYVGDTVMEYGLPESSLRDGFMSILTMEGGRYYVVTTKRDAEVQYYLTEVSSLYGKSALYGLVAATAFAVIFFTLVLFLMSGYREKIFPRWALEDEKNDENERARITSDHEKDYTPMNASGRWNSIFLDWNRMRPEDRARKLFSLGLCLLLLSFIVAEHFVDRVSLLQYIITGDWMRGFNIFALCAVLTVIMSAFLATYLFRQLLMLVTLFQSGRAETICRLIYSFAEYVLVFVTIYYSFTYLGFPTDAVLASAGLATLALTFGAQGMVADILAGVAIVFEGDFQVGDIVELEGFWGRVEEIGIRTSKIVNTSNDVKIIENSQIKNLINKTRYYTCCELKIYVSAEESLTRIEQLLAEHLPEIGKGNEKFLSAPVYLGVSNVSDRTVVPYTSSMELVLNVLCKEQDRDDVVRELNRQLVLLFEAEGIRLR